MKPSYSYKIFPLGDSAITIDFGNLIDEELNHHIVSLFQYLITKPLKGQKEIVPAFSSLTVYYNLQELRNKVDSSKTVFAWIKEKLELLLKNDFEKHKLPAETARIPVCYERQYATDMDMISTSKKINVEEIISIHTSTEYKVYMLGFLPGFAYLGKLDDRISFPRKEQPQNVKAGSVGIAGIQTGIYPLDSPGGWQIIGQTPVKMFDKNREQITLLKTGDTVQFYSISSDEFEDIKSRNT